MRAMRLMSLVILSLLVSDASSQAMAGRPTRKVRWLTAPAGAPQVAVAPSRTVEQDPSWTCIGWGETREDAEERALKRAQEEIRKYLAQRSQPVEWVPNLEFIRKNLVKKWETEPPQDIGHGVGEVQGVRVVVEISPKDWQYILEKDRSLRSESRMIVLAKVLAGLVALLGAVAGYLRVEEMTKGYYTAWLRLAAIGFVTAVGVGIWWVS